MFSCQFSEVSKNSFFTEHLQVKKRIDQIKPIKTRPHKTKLHQIFFSTNIHYLLTITRTTKGPRKAVRPTELKRVDAKIQRNKMSQNFQENLIK